MEAKEINPQVVKAVLMAFFSVLPHQRPRTRLAEQVEKVVSETGSLRRFRDSVRAILDFVTPWSEGDLEEEEDIAAPEFFGYTSAYEKLGIPSAVREEILANPKRGEELASNSLVGRDTDLVVDHPSKRIYVKGKEVKKAPPPLVYDLLVVFLRNNGKPEKKAIPNALSDLWRQINFEHLAAYKHELSKYLHEILPTSSIKSEDEFYALKGVSFLLIDSE